MTTPQVIPEQERPLGFHPALDAVISGMPNPAACAVAGLHAGACLRDPKFAGELESFVTESTRLLIARGLMTMPLPDLDSMRAYIDNLISTDTWAALATRSLPLDTMMRGRWPILARFLDTAGDIIAEAARQGVIIGMIEMLPQECRRLVGAPAERVIRSSKGMMTGLADRVVEIVGGRG